MNVMAPRFRIFCTHPASVTVWSRFSARSSPQVCVLYMEVCLCSFVPCHPKRKEAHLLPPANEPQRYKISTNGMQIRSNFPAPGPFGTQGPGAGTLRRPKEVPPVRTADRASGRPLPATVRMPDPYSARPGGPSPEEKGRYRKPAPTAPPSAIGPKRTDRRRA